VRMMEATTPAKRLRRRAVYLAIGGCLAAGASGVFGVSDDMQDDRNRGIKMARDIRNQIKSRYYDPAFHGVDLDAVFTRAETAIKAATVSMQVRAALAQALEELNDSHTVLIPPMITTDVDYGFETRMVGDRCLVTVVRAKSDAEAKGLRRGDRILAIDGIEPTRRNLETLWYVLSAIQPRGGLNLVAQTGDAAPRKFGAAARITRHAASIEIWQLFENLQKTSRENPTYAWRYWTYKDEKVVVVKLYTFMVTDEMINDLMDQVNEAKALIVDLRGNPGGAIDALRIAAGALFKDEIEMGIQQERKSRRPFRSKRPKSKRLFEGRLVVLVDSASQSSAEVLARVVQIEKRGTVIGDRTAGAVMVSEMIPMNAGNDFTMVPYGLSVTTAKLLMKDGASLEGLGVTPDEIVLPTGDDLRENRDPAMARAAETVGLKLSPSAAWSHFQPAPNATPSPTPAR